MKIRLGFVSNSSSSSFVVAAKPKDLKISITLEIDLNSYVDQQIENKEELEDLMKERYEDDWRESRWKEDYLDFYNDCVAALDEGKTVYYGRVCTDGDDDVEKILCERGIPDVPGITIIQNAER